MAAPAPAVAVAQQPPVQVYAAPVQQGTNGLAIASMVLGILWLYWIGSILAIVFGHIALSQIDKSQGRVGGRGMAIAGVVLGWIGAAILVLAIIFAVAASS